MDLSLLAGAHRRTYLDHAELTAIIAGWANAFPAIAQLRTIGTTAEGRDLHLLVIGREPERLRPAVWVDANMHANELCGSNVALAIAADALRLHLEPDQAPHQLGRIAGERLREVLFYIMPRMSPDGAEHVLSGARQLRSSPSDLRPNHNHCRWQSCDVDGDGRVLLMRVADPGGDYVESSAIANLMLAREIDDDGPFYRLYPEGLIDHFDGHTIPEANLHSDNDTDFNRNFPWGWAPEYEQLGAGAFPASAAETRAVIEFTTAHPNIFAWLNLHSFGGVGIRPLGNASDSQMNQEDLAIYRQVGAWLEEHTGYPMVSGFSEFTYSPEKPLRGDLTDYAYHQRGCIGYVIELWDLFHELGIERKRPFVDHYSQMSRAELVDFARWDARSNGGRAVRPFARFTHPQLGDVEIGGIDPRVGLWNPPYERLADLCDRHSAAFLRVAAMAPAIVVASAVQPVGDDCTRLTLTVTNRGYLPTHILDSATRLDFAEPLYATLTSSGCSLDDASQEHLDLGHLGGWGRGRFTRANAPHGMSSPGNNHEKRVSYLIRGHGRVTIRVGSCRTGWSESHTEI